jgi:hypothetical protein
VIRPEPIPTATASSSSSSSSTVIKPTDAQLSRPTIIKKNSSPPIDDTKRKAGPACWKQKSESPSTSTPTTDVPKHFSSNNVVSSTSKVQENNNMPPPIKKSTPPSQAQKTNIINQGTLKTPQTANPSTSTFNKIQTSKVPEVKKEETIKRTSPTPSSTTTINNKYSHPSTKTTNNTASDTTTKINRLSTESISSSKNLLISNPND